MINTLYLKFIDTLMGLVCIIAWAIVFLLAIIFALIGLFGAQLLEWANRIENSVSIRK